MLVKGLFGETERLLAKVMDFRLLRQNLIHSNIANVDTPTYRATDIQFEPQLKKALEAKDALPLRRTHITHFPGELDNLETVKPLLFFTTPPRVGNDRNSVDLDREMVKVAENNLMYNAAAQILSRRSGGIRYAITEGGR